MPTQNEFADMQAALERLNLAYANALAQVNGTWTAIGAFFIGSTPSLDANKTLLTSCEASISQLAGLEYMQVLNGTRTPESWFGHANEVYATLSSIATDMPSWTFGGVLSQTTDATIAEVEEKVVIGAAIAAPILLAIGALYVVVIFGRH